MDPVPPPSFYPEASPGAALEAYGDPGFYHLPDSGLTGDEGFYPQGREPVQGAPGDLQATLPYIIADSGQQRFYNPPPIPYSHSLPRGNYSGGFVPNQAAPMPTQPPRGPVEYTLDNGVEVGRRELVSPEIQQAMAQAERDRHEQFWMQQAARG